jgi:cystathionine beta-lyase
LVTPVYRGSTVVFETQESIPGGWRASQTGYTYGIYGTPTTRELAGRIATMEGARHTFLVPSGQAAITLVHLSFLSQGSHVLIPVSAYGTGLDLADGMLRRLGIEVERYDPMIGAAIAKKIRPTTGLIWCESPGSVTMEVQDLPAIVAAARARRVPVALDNTYAAGVMLDAFGLGVDVSLQTLTKYVGGHSDLLLGSVSVGTEVGFEKVGETHRLLGMTAAPDECSLALRGLQTLGIRLAAMEYGALKLAKWLAERPEIERVLHPALPNCPGHEFWKRDFTGSASLFSVVFRRGYTTAQVNGFVNALRLFKIGFSWGGTTSLVMGYPEMTRPGLDYAGRIVRLHVGLEEVEDLQADLEQGFGALTGL